jgi:hypothetical protein
MAETGTPPETRKRIISLVRKAVRAASEGRPKPTPPDIPALNRRGGAFVTLKHGERLRGCIGHFTGEGTLGETLVSMATAAAVRDPRFEPVRPREVDDLSVQVSLLSPMEETDPADVVPGTHGIYIRSGPFAGTLLPQVAREEGWDRETFLAHTCLKAGLSPDCWKRPGTTVYTYTAEVFGDNGEEAS